MICIELPFPMFRSNGKKGLEQAQERKLRSSPLIGHIHGSGDVSAIFPTGRHKEYSPPVAIIYVPSDIKHHCTLQTRRPTIFERAATEILPTSHERNGELSFPSTPTHITMARMLPVTCDTTTSSATAAARPSGNLRTPLPEPPTAPLFSVVDATTITMHQEQQPQYSHAHENEDEDADAPHAFGIEKGFWKIHSAAQELLKFAAIYQSGPSTSASAPGSDRRLPKEIDMLSMMQLSQSVLHAVGDINSHNQRLHGLAARAPGRCERRAAVRAARKKRRHARADADGQYRRGCIECGAAESPCWRMGPAGPLTLCNVCGLLFAKRSEVAATIGEGEGSDDG
ncbi:hypothetical protein B0T18DRAFT_397706 [Schizothecium vesticola]|uniref:GATA-type domain-containing protein n=1 Tax=Schizothecium vesticola TaxID=314040 RepID=A0AA40KCC3_9PEZI|nr:hypothetical protein B0T18DRAFT_397706 [Schizothecium vesticola]